MTQIKYARVGAILVLAAIPTLALGQPIVCVSTPPDPCGGRTDCVPSGDVWRIIVQPGGQISLRGESVTRSQLEKFAAAWAKSGTWPIIVGGSTGTASAQISAIVEMLKKAGVWTQVSCVATKP